MRLEHGLHRPAGVSPALRKELTLPETQASLDALFEHFLRWATARNGGASLELRDWVDLAEAWRITRALRECRGNRSAAARILGIGRRTLYSKMEKLQIAPHFSAWSVESPPGPDAA